MNLRARLHRLRLRFSKENLKRLKTMTFWKHFVKKHRRKLFWALGIIIAIIISIPIFTYIYFAGDLKDKQSVTNYNRTGLTLLDDEGKPFFTFYHPKAVTYVPLSEMPKSLQHAVIAAEDRDFYQNPGFSVTGMTRAFIRNFFAGEIVEGGSTISQELVKNALLNSHRNYFRKYQELVLATELNRRFSKEDILEMYLNSVYFGEGAVGIENAAQAYFGIPAKELTLSQATLLAGLLPAPSAYSPLSNDPQRALRRQQIVLSQMVEENYITSDQAKQALNTELTYNPAPQEETNILAPHFALYVKDQLIKKYGEERIIREGFSVKTTLNSTWQTYAEQVVKNQISYLARNKATNGAVIVLDPQTGAIKVMVGSHDWNDENNGKINMAVHPRQPGSSFKPIIYSDALEQKIITPASILHDKAISYGSYKPLNYDKSFRGDVTVRRALSNSLNIPAVEVLNQLGIGEGLEISKKFGITTLKDSPTKYGLPLVLGSGEVPLIEMTNAYGVFADQGTYRPAYAISEVKNKYDEVITDQKSNWLKDFLNMFNFYSMIGAPAGSGQPRKVISDDAAFLISSILSDNNARAEVFGSSLTISRPAAVKTGTTNDYKDALTIGYTPSLVIGVWVGNNDNTPMDNIAGSMGAAPIWRLLMERYLAGKPLENFFQPPGVVKVGLCTTPTPSAAPSVTPSVSPLPVLGEEYFIRGTEPDACPTPTPSNTPAPSESPTPTSTPEPSATPTEAPEPTVSPSPTPTGVSLPSLTPVPTL
jgi:1A family penicillin-binding protein